MQELSKCLSLPPARIDCSFTELPEECEADIRNILQRGRISIHDWEHDLLCYYADNQKCISNTLVVCSQVSHLAESCKEANPNALWGLATSSLAIVYGIHDKYIVWHEMLHLLGANDCYDLSRDNRGPNCELPNCVM